MELNFGPSSKLTHCNPSRKFQILTQIFDSCSPYTHIQYSHQPLYSLTASQPHQKVLQHNWHREKAERMVKHLYKLPGRSFDFILAV